jgi:hypothetical protein
LNLNYTNLATRLNTIPTIALDYLNNPNTIFPAGITGNDVKIYSIHSSDPDFIQVALQNYEVLGLDPGDGGDGGVGTSSVPPTIYSRSVGIGMPTAMKTKINNIQTISFSTDGNQYSIFPASIQGNDVKLYSFHARSNFMSVQVVSFQGTTLDSFSHSIGIDLASDVKDKINNIQRIQKESTTATTYIYPVELSGT